MRYEKVFNTIDTQIQGEVFRIVLQSPMKFINNTLNNYQKHLNDNYDVVKGLLLNEPRGYRGINGVIPIISEKPEELFITFNHEMSRYAKPEAAIALIATKHQMGLLSDDNSNSYIMKSANEEVNLEIKDTNSYVVDFEIDKVALLQSNDFFNTCEYENIKYLVYQGIGIELKLENLSALKQWSKTIHREVGVILVAYELRTDGEFTSITFEEDGFIRRSPGIVQTGIIGSLVHNQPKIINNSIFESRLIAREMKTNLYQIETEAFVIASHEFVFDEEDPFDKGFIIV